MAIQLLQSLGHLLGGQQQGPPPIQPRQNAGPPIMVTPRQYQGTFTGFQRLQGSSMPQVNPNDRQPAFTGGYDVRQLNVPNSYAHPQPQAHYITPPQFHLPPQGSHFNLSSIPAPSAPPRMVNVDWSSTPVSYQQSLNPPQGY